MDEATRTRLHNLKMSVRDEPDGRIALVIDDWVIYEAAVVCCTSTETDLPDDYLREFMNELATRWNARCA